MIVAADKQIRAWHLSRRTGSRLSGLAGDINSQVRGWINYYGSSTAPSCIPLHGVSTNISSDGPCRSSSVSEESRRGHGSGWPTCARVPPSCSPTGSLPGPPTTDLWEPYDWRRSRTVLREREGEAPSRHSPDGRELEKE
jgi:hypothetical protein